MASFSGYTSPYKKENKDPVSSFSGYVTDVSEVMEGKQKDPLKSPSKYFDFNLQSKSGQKRAICFSPQKRKLLMDLNDSDNFGVEMKNAKLNKLGELVVNDHTRMMKTPLNYEKPTFEIIYSTIEQCTNEYEMYQVVNVKAQLKNIQPPETAKFQGTDIEIQNAVMADETGVMEITFYAPLLNKVEEGKFYSITNLKIHSFNNQRYLKINKNKSVITLLENEAPAAAIAEVPQINVTFTSARITSVDMKSFETSVKCPTCNAVIGESSIDNDVVICESCGSMSGDCNIINMAKIFVKETQSSERIQLAVPFLLLTKAFPEVRDKEELGKKMIRSKVTLMFSMTDKKVKELHVNKD